MRHACSMSQRRTGTSTTGSAAAAADRQCPSLANHFPLLALLTPESGHEQPQSSIRSASACMPRRDDSPAPPTSQPGTQSGSRHACCQSADPRRGAGRDRTKRLHWRSTDRSIHHPRAPGRGVKRWQSSHVVWLAGSLVSRGGCGLPLPAGLAAAADHCRDRDGDGRTEGPGARDAST